MPKIYRPAGRRLPSNFFAGKQWQPPQQSAAAPRTDNPAVAIPAQLDPSLTPNPPNDHTPHRKLAAHQPNLRGSHPQERRFGTSCRL